jgi:hypothetical protein
VHDADLSPHLVDLLSDLRGQIVERAGLLVQDGHLEGVEALVDGRVDVLRGGLHQLLHLGDDLVHAVFHAAFRVQHAVGGLHHHLFHPAEVLDFGADPLRTAVEFLREGVDASGDRVDGSRDVAVFGGDVVVEVAEALIAGEGQEGDDGRVLERLEVGLFGDAIDFGADGFHVRQDLLYVALLDVQCCNKFTKSVQLRLLLRFVVGKIKESITFKEYLLKIIKTDENLVYDFKCSIAHSVSW